MNNNTLLKAIINVTIYFTIASIALFVFAAYLSFNVVEPILQYYHQLNGPIHQHYISISITYLITIPLFISLASQPFIEQFHYHHITLICRQYILHTPIALFLIIAIYFTRMQHPTITSLLYLLLIQSIIFVCGYQHIFNISEKTQQEYENNIKKLSQHEYIHHIRTTKISTESNPNHTIIQTLILPPYYHTIKKIRYNRTITQNTH